MSKQKFIEIKGARVHNLKNMDVSIPHGKMTVITGLSGSGKSSLAFDTLYAEGQRRYIESLSSYARQFLGKLNKPETDYIKGIAPAVAIEQKVISSNPRSTVGTTTEIYDYLKILFARVGRTISPISGNEVKKHSVSDVVDFLRTLPEGEKALIVCSINGFEKYGVERQLDLLKQQGYIRLWLNNEILNLDETIANQPVGIENALLVIDRLSVVFNEENESRYADSISLAFLEGHGECAIVSRNDFAKVDFSNRFELDGMEFQEPNEHFFTFNNPFGACKTCEGFGQVIGIDPELVIPNQNLSVYEGAVAPWKGESMGEYLNELVFNAKKFDFPIHRPYCELTEKEKEVLWNGNKYFTGINGFFKFVESQTYKIQYRVMLSRYRGRTECPDCKGTRLRKDANYVKVDGHSITDVVLMPIEESHALFSGLNLSDYDRQVSKRILPEIISRLSFLKDVGLGYLTLNRQSNSLSGGESQRINLATSLGSSLVGSMYILDEPSIGLHPKDTERLIEVLKDLRDLGNTVIVVEHDEDIMKAADMIIDIGPEAGTHGGQLVAQGKYEEILTSDSLTAKYLSGRDTIEVPKKRRKFKNHIEVIGARENNLKNIDVTFPLDCLTVITGVSGSGKSTLVKKILFPALQKKLTGLCDKAGQFTALEGSYSHIKNIEYVDQNPIGRSSRSNPVTYIKAYDDIRDLFAKQNTSKLRGYQAKHFSFNVDGGRCETCKGDGEVTIEMQFMADVHLECETCGGKRFKKEVLEVNFEGKNIDDVLKMTIDEALEFFTLHKQAKITQKLQPLQDVGLGYVQLGQSSSTLSGGEAQRIKLASFLVKGTIKDKALFVFDEPTTGLHFHDIKKLLASFDALLENI